MKYTANYNLKKPEGTDIVNIDDLNENADIIDQKLKELENGVYNAPPNSVSDVAIGTRTPNQTQTPASPGSGTLSQILSWLANRIKAITGKTNWWEDPPTTLQAAKNHIDAAAPHSGHETPSGAQAKANAAENNAKSYASGLVGALTSLLTTSKDNIVNSINEVVNTLTNHINGTAVHGATSAASANRIIIRDASGRAKVAAPSASDDIARKQEVDTVQANLNTHANSKQTHGISSGYYIAKTSRSDQLPDWNDIQGKPSLVLASDLNKTINVPGDYPTIQDALNSLKKTWIPKDVTVTIQVAAGTYNHTSPINIDHPQGLRIMIVGATPTTTTITGVGAITGSAGNWLVPINVKSTSGINVGDFVLIRNTNGTGNFKVFEGVWEVIAINSGTQLTVKNTCRKSTFPTAGLTGGNLIALKTKLVFNNSEAIKTHPLSAIGLIDNIVFIGNRAGQYSGITIGARWIADSYGDFSRPDFGPAKLYLGSNVGVTGFGGHGISLVHGGILTAMGGVCSCNNNGNGIDIGSGANAKIDNFIANGNANNGIELGDGGTAWAFNATACGNGNRGVVSGAGAYVECTNAYVSDNIDTGILANNGGVIWAWNARSKNNGGNGFAAINMGFIQASGTEASNNSIDYYTWLTSVISCPGYIGSPIFSPAQNTEGNNNSIILTI